MKKRRLVTLAAVAAVAFVLACLIVDFFPHHGAPHFRYTGSDPAYPVWNVGWPLALLIYDPRTGFHVCPFAYIVLPFQLFLVAVILVVMAVQRLHNPPIPRTPKPSSMALAQMTKSEFQLIASRVGAVEAIVFQLNAGELHSLIHLRGDNATPEEASGTEVALRSMAADALTAGRDYFVKIVRPSDASVGGRPLYCLIPSAADGGSTQICCAVVPCADSSEARTVLDTFRELLGGRQLTC